MLVETIPILAYSVTHSCFQGLWCIPSVLCVLQPAACRGTRTHKRMFLYGYFPNSGETTGTKQPEGYTAPVSDLRVCERVQVSVWTGV